MCNCSARRYAKVTFPMLHTALKRLQMWRSHASFKLITEYLRRNYPIRTDTAEFRAELKRALTCATDAGLILKEGGDRYCLPTFWQRIHLSINAAEKIRNTLIDAQKKTKKSRRK